MTKGTQKRTFSSTHFYTPPLIHLLLKFNFSITKTKDKQEISRSNSPLQILSHSVALYYFGHNVARVPSEDVSSVMLQVGDYI